MKKLWKNNRVVFVLIIILIVCFISIVSVALTFFYAKDTSEYGNRLVDIEKHPVSNDFKASYKDNLLNNESVKEVSFNLKGRVIYINVSFDENIKLEDAQKLIDNSLELFEEDIISYYDINFVLKSDNFTIMGAKNTKNENISWNNNTPIKEEEESNE